jgi:hypothetical protein
MKGAYNNTHHRFVFTSVSLFSILESATSTTARRDTVAIFSRKRMNGLEESVVALSSDRSDFSSEK